MSEKDWVICTGLICLNVLLLSYLVLGFTVSVQMGVQLCGVHDLYWFIFENSQHLVLALWACWGMLCSIYAGPFFSHHLLLRKWKLPSSQELPGIWDNVQAISEGSCSVMLQMRLICIWIFLLEDYRVMWAYF